MRFCILDFICFTSMSRYNVILGMIQLFIYLKFIYT